MPTRVAVVRAVAAALGEARTEEEVAVAVLNSVTTHLGAFTASLWLLTADGTELVLAHERNAHHDAISKYARIPTESDLPGPQVLRNNQPFFVTSRQERDERWPGVAGTPTPSEALAILPLAVGGETLGVVTFGWREIRSFDSLDEIALMAVADQCAIALDRARLYQAVRADAEANHLLARIMSEASAHDWMAVARHTAAVCIDGFVDSCALYVREGGIVRLVAAASKSYGEITKQAVGRFPTPVSADATNARVIRNARPIHIGPTDPSTDAASGDEYERLIRSVELGDAWMLPLMDGPSAFGAMLFATAPGVEITEDMLVLAGEIAHRTATLLRSAAEFSQHRAAVEAMQAVLLPSEIPVLDDFELAAVYVPFTAGPNVGGDWWDVLMLPNGKLALGVGDVAGHGIPAVAVMGQLRNAMRSRLVAGVDPAGVLTEVSALLSWTTPDSHATAIVAVIDPATGDFEWSSAGHPPAVLRTASNDVDVLSVPAAPPLGVRIPGRDYENHRGSVHTGDALLLYSDGLIERRDRSLDDGLAVLVDAVRRLDPATPLQLRAEQLVANLVDRPEDDICVVVALRLSPSQPEVARRA